MEFIEELKAILEVLGVSPTTSHVIIFVTIIGAILITALGFVFKGLSAWSLWRRQRVLVRTLNKEDYSNDDIYSHTDNYIQTRFTTDFQEAQSLMYDSAEDRKEIKTQRKRLVPHLLKRFNNPRENSKYYIILADSGMGKTTFTLNLFLAVNRQRVALFSTKTNTAEVFPVRGRGSVLSNIEDIEDKKNCVLIIDALDEYPGPPYAVEDYLFKLLQKVKPFSQVVITCRTQFFATVEDQLPKVNHRTAAGGYEHVFVQYYILPFSNGDVTRYLFKRFSPLLVWNVPKFIRAYKAVKKVPHLALRPMLLDHISYLLSTKKDLTSTFQVYEELISKWIEREVLKNYGREDSGKQKYETMLFDLCKRIAAIMYESGHLDFSPIGSNYTLLGRELSKLLNEYGEGMDNEPVNQFGSVYRYRSLINRSENNRYKFSHRSIYEFFLSKLLIEEKLRIEDFDFKTYNMSWVFTMDLFIQTLQTYKTDYVLNGKFRPLLKLTAQELPLISEIILNTPNTTVITLLRQYRNLDYITIVDVPRCSHLYGIYKLLDEMKGWAVYKEAIYPFVKATAWLPNADLKHLLMAIGIERTSDNKVVETDFRNWGTLDELLASKNRSLGIYRTAITGMDEDLAAVPDGNKLEELLRSREKLVLRCDELLADISAINRTYERADPQDRKAIKFLLNTTSIVENSFEVKYESFIQCCKRVKNIMGHAENEYYTLSQKAAAEKLPEEYERLIMRLQLKESGARDIIKDINQYCSAMIDLQQRDKRIIF